MNRAFKTGFPVRLSEGEYRIGDRLLADRRSHSAPVEIAGVGSGKSTLTIDHLSSGLEIFGNRNTPTAVRLKGFSVARKNTSLYQGKVGPKSVYIADATNCEIDDVEEYGAIGFGIQLDRCQKYSITHCKVHDHFSGSTHRSGTDGIHIYRSKGPGIVTSNEVSRVGDDAISFGSYDKLLFTGNVVCDANRINDVAGSIKIYGNANNFLIKGNHISKAQNGGVTLWDDRDLGQSFDIDNVIISDNVIELCGGPSRSGGVYITQTKGNGRQKMRHIQVANNKISECKNGITVRSVVSTKSTEDLTIENNIICCSTERGIFLESGEGEVQIKGNVINGSGFEGVLIQASRQANYDIESNTITDFGLSTSGSYNGIWLRDTGEQIAFNIQRNKISGIMGKGAINAPSNTLNSVVRYNTVE
jgi:hypothetical protein